MSDIASPLQSCRKIEVGDLLCEWFSHLASYAGEPKPFLGIYDPHWLDRNTGDARVALDSLRQACCEAGFAGICLVAQHRENETPKLADFARWGFDSVYAYTWYDRNAVQQQEQLLAHWAHGLIDILPTLSMGWDLRPWGGQQGLWLPAAEFQGLCDWAKHTYMPAAPSDAISRRVVMLDNWNEFGEGHSMMPCAGWGFAYLNAARDVFGQAPYPPNALPTATQSARLDTLYPPGWRNGNT